MALRSWKCDCCGVDSCCTRGVKALSPSCFQLLWMVTLETVEPRLPKFFTWRIPDVGNLQGITQNFPVAKWEGMSSKCLDERDEGCWDCCLGLCFCVLNFWIKWFYCIMNGLAVTIHRHSASTSVRLPLQSLGPWGCSYTSFASSLAITMHRIQQLLHILPPFPSVASCSLGAEEPSLVTPLTGFL